MIMQMEAERMRGLALSADEAASELAVVLSERQQRTDNSPQGLFEERLRAALFPGHPYGRPVIGWRKEIERLSPQDARAQYDRYYRPDNAILVVSGDVKSADVLRLAAGTFGKLPASETPGARAEFPPPLAPFEKRIEMRDGRVKQPYVTWRFAVASAMTQRKNESDALTVLAEVLSGGEVGLLYRRFVVETQKAGGLDVSYDPAARGPAVFSIAATPASGGDVRQLEKEIDAYLLTLSRKGLSRADVSAAKRRLQDGAVFARDRLMAPAEILGEALAIGQKIEAVEKWPEAIGAVSAAQVNEAFRKLVSSSRQVRGILEPAEGTAP
jgi:zinc protease